MVIGWLCGIGLAFGLMFVARSAPWLAVVHWLHSSHGLYVQSGAAMVFQLSGGALVVRDVVRAEKNLAWLDYWFAELEHAIGDVDAEQQASRAAEGVESIYEPLFQAELRFRKLEGATNILASYQSRTRDGRPWLKWTWLTWLGPVLLLLGIGLAGTASLFAIYL